MYEVVRIGRAAVAQRTRWCPDVQRDATIATSGSLVAEVSAAVSPARTDATEAV
jgi:hypothetical protein